MEGRQREVQPGYVDRLFSLEDRVCVVAGAGSGLGEAVATGFAQSGARVIAADIRVETVEALAELVTETRHPLTSRALDVTRKADVDQFVASIVDEFGHIDVLCTSAGTAARYPAEDYPEDVYDRIILLNLKGSFLMAQAVGRTMLARRSGSIINIASIGGSIAYPGSTAYNQSKGGVVQMTRSLALEWADRGVRVNAIAPSLFNTPSSAPTRARSRPRASSSCNARRSGGRASHTRWSAPLSSWHRMRRPWSPAPSWAWMADT